MLGPSFAPADINAAHADGDTALHGAADDCGSEAIIRFLVQHSARLDARNRAGQQPLDAAFAHRDRAITLLRTARSPHPGNGWVALFPAPTRARDEPPDDITRR